MRDARRPTAPVGRGGDGARAPRSASSVGQVGRLVPRRPRTGRVRTIPDRPGAAEQHSNVNQAEASALAQDEEGVVQDLESALTKSEGSYDVRYLEDAVDFSVTGSPGIHIGQRFVPFPQVPDLFPSELSAGLALFASSASGSNSPIERLLDQVMVVAKHSKPPRASQSALNRSYNRLADALGWDAITNLGPGEPRRDALVVYYHGQVNRFMI